MYKSPIEIIHEIQSGVKMQIENGILEAVGHYGINVDKDELIRALQYDRQQYEKGYDDGKAEALQWIPCSERLPSESGEYLITGVGISPCVYQSFYYKRENVWSYRNLTVTAWMPLPEPYKVERREDE